MKIGLIVLVLFIAVCNAFSYWNMRCPSQSEWGVISTWVCNGTETKKYTCLYNAIRRQYEESCKFQPVISGNGSQYVISVYPNSEPCRNYDRYQPFPLGSNAGSDCIFQKSTCSEEGNILFHHGSPKTDLSCRCNFQRGFGFVNEIPNKCDCIPSQEDCSCYLKQCPLGHRLISDYACLHEDDRKHIVKCPEMGPENSRKMTPHLRRLSSKELKNIEFLNRHIDFIGLTCLTGICIVYAIVASLLIITNKIPKMCYIDICPFDLKITPVGNSLLISWSISDKIPTKDILGYNIYYTNNGNWTRDFVKEDKQYIFNKLKPSKTYRFKVSVCLKNRVKSECTEEKTFNTESLFSIVCAIDICPFNLKITPDGSSLRISWSISNEVPTIDILGYNIHYTYNGQWKQFGVRKYKQYSFDNLKPRKTYRFKVSACLRNRVKSKCTEEVTFNTELPIKPKVGIPKGKNSKIELTWNSPTNTLIKIEGYEIRWSIDDWDTYDKTCVASNVFRHEIETAKEGVIYLVEICSCSNSVKSEPKAFQPFTTRHDMFTMEVKYEINDQKDKDQVRKIVNEILQKAFNGFPGNQQMTHESERAGSIVVTIMFISEDFNDEEVFHDVLKCAFEMQMFESNTIVFESFWLKRQNDPLPPRLVQASNVKKGVLVSWKEPLSTFFKTKEYVVEYTEDDWTSTKSIVVPVDENSCFITKLLPSANIHVKVYTCICHSIRSSPSPVVSPVVKDTHLNTIKVWKQDDELYYDTTNVYQTTKDLIKSCSVVTLVGGPGCGKTATARHIALQYEQNGWEIVPVFKVEDIVLYGESRLKQIFVLDDVLGEFAVNTNLCNNIDTYRNGIMYAIGEESKLLFTCRKSVYSEAIKLRLFVLKNIIDFQSKGNILNECEKENILVKHCRHKGVPGNIYCNLSLSSSFTMFPLLCKIFSATYEKHVSVDNFFANPFNWFNDELDMLEYFNPQQYAALVLCVLSSNMFSFEKIADDENEMKLDAYKTCGVNLGTSDKLIKDALSNLVGTYLLENENHFNFIHDAIFEIVAYHYGKNNPQMILKYMKSNFISSKVTVDKNKIYDFTADLSILIDEKYYEQLAERLYTDLQSFEMTDVFMNKSLRYLPFLKVFIKTLVQKPYNELKALICQVHASSKIISIYSHNNPKTGMNENIYKELSTPNLPKKNVCSFGRVLHNPRIISLIIYYGHTNLLTRIISLVHEHNDSTDIVFGSDIIEQTQLLILGCYSDEPDMVDSILKYVKIDCINRPSLITILYCVEDEKFVTDVRKNRKYTPLTIACQLGNLSIVQILMSYKANIDQCSESSRFPLLTASEQGHYDVVKYLVQKGCNVNQCNEYGESSLQRVSYYGHYNVVKYLVQQGANVNQCDGNKKSPLYNASEGGHKAVVEFLMENGADFLHSDKNNQSPLYKACQKGQTAIVEFLVEKGADINQCNKYGNSPLYEACFEGHKAVAEFLVWKGANVNQCNTVNESPLYRASAGGHLSIVEFIVDKGANVNQCNTDGNSPLYKACKGGHTAVIEFLVEKGANVNKCNRDGNSPLYKACEEGHTSIVEFLVDKGADVNQCSADSKSPLYKACTGGHTSIAEFLVNKGADVNQCNTDNQSPLHKACGKGHKAVVEFLVENRADVNHCDKDNMSPLYNATRFYKFPDSRRHEDMLDIVQYLIQNGADVHKCTKSNESSLFGASDSGYVDVAELLVQKGAVVNQCNTIDKSPLYLASKQGYVNVVEYLVQQGANVNQCDIEKRSPLYKASKGGHKDVVEFLVDNGAVIHKCSTKNQSPLYKACQSGHTAVVEFLVEKGADVHQCDTDNISPLYKASEGGYKAIVEFLVDNGAVVDICDKNNQSPLYKACEGGHKAVVEFLVDKGADVNQCNTDDISPLYKACEGRHTAVVEFLVKQGADVHQCDIYNRSPLYRAFEGGCKFAVDFPVKRVADIS